VKAGVGGALRVAAWLAAALPALLSAQEDPRLVSAVRLAQEGLGDSARAVVSGLLARTDPTDTLYPQMLYTRAVVTADPRELRTDLQRVAVEYASSNWADDALLRLALLDYAAGQLDGAARTLERFELDHSASPLYARAAMWAGRTFFGLRRPEDACRWIRAGQARVGGDLELRNQLEFAGRRCTNVALAAEQPAGRDTAAATADTAAPALRTDTVPSARAPAPPAPAPASAPAFRIQIAAVNAAAAADTIAARARATGIETVVVREAPYYKVRVGRYATRAEAAAALPAVRARFRGTPFVVAARE
jgi:hypothetical protein